jgi:hypothetical protein
MITTQDLQALNKAVHDARRAGDDVAYEAALDAYSKALDAWAKEGREVADEARAALVNDPALRRLFKQG